MSDGIENLDNTVQGVGGGIDDISKTEPNLNAALDISKIEEQSTNENQDITQDNVEDTSSTGENQDQTGDDTAGAGGDDNAAEDGADDSEEQTVDLFMDDDGNLIDGEGNLVKKKGEYEVDEQGNPIIYEDTDQEILRLKGAITNEYGIEFKDEHGQPLDFENTDQGFLELTKFVSEQLQKKELAKMWEEMPNVAAYRDHLLAGGNDQDFFSIGTQYRQLSIPESTDDNKDYVDRLNKDIIIEKHMVMHGTDNMSEEEFSKLRKEAEDFYEFYHAKGEEGNKAKADLQWLQQREAQQQADRDAANKATLKAKKEANDAYWGEVKANVMSGKLNRINIPEQEREAFYKYIAVPVNQNGETQEMIDRREGSINDGIELAYLRYKKFNLDNIINNRILSEKAQTLRKAKKKAVIIKRGRGQVVSKETNNVGHINIAAITNYGKPVKATVKSKDGISDIN